MTDTETFAQTLATNNHPHKPSCLPALFLHAPKTRATPRNIWSKSIKVTDHLPVARLWGEGWLICSSRCTHYRSLIVWQDESHLACSNRFLSVSLKWSQCLTVTYFSLFFVNSLPLVMKCSSRDNLQQIYTLRVQPLPPNFSSLLFCAHDQATFFLAT